MAVRLPVDERRLATQEPARRNEELSVIEFIKTHWLWFLLILPVIIIATTFATLASISMLLISLPPDYFTRKRRMSRIKNPILRLFLRLLKNVGGAVFLIAGFIMLFTPGPGVLSALVGVILCDFPGKRRVERKIIARPRVLSMINRIRARYNRPLLMLDD
ncbi:hypothetical protein C6496_24230 [Candidatus Poribacteria bacterium]|nr:MAG: hypothetical protein C6496_24230 [Candidatus Poribacteria bacterium]